MQISPNWLPCHHGVARPHVAGGEDGLQIWMVAANILNKQYPTAEKGWSSHCKKKTYTLLRNVTQASDLDRFFKTT
jgi:hypothetical protein